MHVGSQRQGLSFADDRVCAGIGNIILCLHFPFDFPFPFGTFVNDEIIHYLYNLSQDIQ